MRGCSLRAASMVPAARFSRHYQHSGIRKDAAGEARSRSSRPANGDEIRSARLGIGSRSHTRAKGDGDGRKKQGNAILGYRWQLHLV